MNGTKIQLIKEDMTYTYKYLNVDENVSYNGSLNKEFEASTSKEFEKYGVVNSVDITSTSRTMHLLYPF